MSNIARLCSPVALAVIMSFVASLSSTSILLRPFCCHAFSPVLPPVRRYLDPFIPRSLAVSHKSATEIAAEKPSQRRRNAFRKDRHGEGYERDPEAWETWRIYGISIHPDDLVSESNSYSSKEPPVPAAVKRFIHEKYLKGQDNSKIRMSIVRRSLDARKKLKNPQFVYVVDVTVKGKQSKRWKHQPGRMERLSNVPLGAKSPATTEECQTPARKKTVVIVGAGPAGLFCALQLALTNQVSPILVERGQPVEKRGRDIGALIHRRWHNSESNFAFGEGGAGTWSDGKLTTRIGRNSESVRYVLETLVKYGAPADILWHGSPHLGTDNLVRLLRNMRLDLVEHLDTKVLFGTKMVNLVMSDDSSKESQTVEGVVVEDSDGSTRTIQADAVVLATGHSARDVYESLYHAGVKLEPKGFAVGFRIEHPQALINDIQYGKEWGPCIQTGKSSTDNSNLEYFGQDSPTHPGRVPVSSYRLATDKADDGTGTTRGVYSFCMCPGGQIVPSSTDPDEVCINGMSFSRRDSVWANSALVVTIFGDDVLLQPYEEEFRELSGLEFQRRMERKAAQLGGGNWTVPVQRVTDFISGVQSEDLPSSSYRLGVKSAPLHELYPPQITTAIRHALTDYFSKQMPGYVHPDGLLHAVETRTSSPVRVSRDRQTYLAVGTSNLFPAGEGAGFAGGIVSAAVDGLVVSEAVLDRLYGSTRPNRKVSSGKSNIGFAY